MEKEKYTILVAEDDKAIVDLLKLYLVTSGYDVLVAYDGEEAYDLFKSHDVDLALVDIMMPKLDGYGLTKLIRQDSSIPVIILSAKSEDMDKILGLNIGADDYITKPFNSLEVLARVQAHLRRFYDLNQINSVIESVTIGELTLDLVGAILSKNDVKIKITATEFKILELFMTNPGQIFTKIEIYKHVNQEYVNGDENTIMVHIANLRDKIEDDNRFPRYIKTVRGIGYKFEKEV